MSENSKNVQTQYFGIHYYFDDDSHSMDAFTRNKMEKNYLDIIMEIAQIMGIEVQIESQSRKEGGVIDFLLINVSVKDTILAGIIFLAPTINKFATYYLTGQYKQNKLNAKLKELQIERYEIKNEIEKHKFQELIKEKNKELYESQKIRYLLSSLYKKAMQYKKIVQIGYIDYENNQAVEEKVERDKFDNFIFDTVNDTHIDDEANIEIISPVLKEGRFKWKGIYKGAKIDFSMGDSVFKNAVIGKKYNFENGSTIICKLEIKNTFDEFGEITKNPNYCVAKVYKVIKNDIVQKTNAGYEKDKQIAQSKERSFPEFECNDI